MLDEFGDISDENQSLAIEALVKEYEEADGESPKFLDEESLVVITDYYIGINKNKQAMVACEQGLGRYPHSLDLLLMRAQLLAFDNKIKEAHETVDMAELFNPSDDDVHIMRASLHTMAGDFNLSIDILEGIFSQVPDDEKESVCFQLAQAYLGISDYPNASKYLKQCIEINQSNEAALYELFFCLEESEMMDDILPFYQKFVDEDPYSYAAWFNLGVTYSKLEQFDEAIDAYTYAVTIKENLPSAWFNLGNAHMNLENFQEALEAYLNVERYESPTAESLTHLAAAYEKLESYENAIKKYRAAIELDDLWDDAWYGVASCLYEMDRAFEAISFVKKAIEINPFDADSFLLLGDVESAVGNTFSACEAYEAASKLDAEYPDIWLQWAEVYYEQGEYSEAVDTIMAGIDAVPDEAELFYRAAVYLIYDKRFSEAYSYLELALTLDFELHSCIFEYFPNLEMQKKLFKLIEQYRK